MTYYVKLHTTCITRQDIIASFNVRTNEWASRYVYKRLRFLECKPLSRAVTLAFLALWHGFHSGYHLLFAHEFVVTGLEEQLLKEVRVRKEDA